MFNFLNLGFEGFKRIAIKDLRNARMLSRALDASYFKVNFPFSYAYDYLMGGIRS
jgi:glutamate/tyrosine decarboxylase-like PLP-dependent enzyme